MSGPAEIPLEELRFRLRGELYGPGDARYEEACASLDSVELPRLVAGCSAPEDVVAALAFARQENLAVAVRGGASSGGQTPCDGGLLIDLRGMRDVDIDYRRGVARVGPGAIAGEIDDLLAAQLVTPEGEIVRVEADGNPDLLALLRDGSGEHGVVTSLELRLPPRR